MLMVRTKSVQALLVVGVLAAWSLPAAAQTVRIECVSFPKREREKIELLVGPGKTVELTLQSHALSVPLQVPRMPVWRFGKSEEDDEGKFKFTTHAQVKPGPAKRQLLVFIRKGREMGDGFMVVTLDGGRNGFGEGKMLFVNLSRRPVAGQVGGKRFVLPPTKHRIIAPVADRGEGFCYAVLRYQQGEDWRTFFSTNWPVLEDARGLVFTYDDPKGRSLKLHSIVDSLLELPEQPPPGS
jgi:hypothetical protein